MEVKIDEQAKQNLIRDIDETNRWARIQKNADRMGQTCAICGTFFFEDEDPLKGGWCEGCHKSMEATQNEQIFKEGENGD